MDWNSIPNCINSSEVPTLLCIPGLVANIIYWLLVFAGVAALFMIVFSGIKFINSGGDSKAVESARKTFTYALLGLILVFTSFAIVSLIGKVTGVGSSNLLKFEFPEYKQDQGSSGTSGNAGNKNVTCNPKTQVKKCTFFTGCHCYPKPAEKTCEESGKKTVCDPNNPSSCKCLAKNWPSCSSLVSECGPGYTCDTNQKKCTPKNPITCSCKTDGGYAPNNGYTCTDGDSGNFCADYQQCQGTTIKPNLPCKSISCSCDNLSGGSGNG